MMLSNLTLTRRLAVAAVAVALLPPVALRADVKTQEKSRLQFGGALGRVMNMFGGAATRDGVISTVAVRGDRMLTANQNTGELVDLAEEKIYRIDYRDKSYRVVTFAELRRQTEQSMEQMRKSNPQSDAPQQTPQGDAARELEVDFSVKPTGQTKTVAGLQASENLATVIVRAKGKTLEQSGGMVLTAHLWQAPDAPGMRDMTEFRMKYAMTLYGAVMADASSATNQAMAMYPAMKDAMKRFAEESRKLSGVTLATETVYEVVPDPAQASSQTAGRDEAPAGMPTSLGGLLGGIGRRMGRQKAEEAQAAGSGTPGRTMVMTTSSETLQITAAVADADVAVPAGFKLKQ